MLSESRRSTMGREIFAIAVSRRMTSFAMRAASAGGLPPSSSLGARVGGEVVLALGETEPGLVEPGDDALRVAQVLPAVQREVGGDSDLVERDDRIVERARVAD